MTNETRVFDAMLPVLDALELSLKTVLGQLEPIAQEHRSTLTIGRTHARPALPSTFGLKVAGWMDELLRHLERIREAPNPYLPASRLYSLSPRP